MSNIRRGVWTNWAGNQTARPSAVHRPANEDELSAIVSRAANDRTTVKALGSGHSFTATSVTTGAMIDMSRLSRLIAVDRAASTVTVEAGITIADLNLLLNGLGLALPNLGDIAYQTISGAIATSTHGTGRALTGIAAQVVAMRVVAGDGSVLDLSPEHHPTLFHAARVGVGALGIVSRVTLRVVPAFRLRAVEGAQRLDDLVEQLDEHVDGNDHFEFFWIPHTKWALTKRNNRTDEPVSIPSPFKHWYAKTFMENYAFGAVCRLGRARPNLIPRLATALPSTGQSTIVDESYRIFASQRLVRFVEMEYAIPREACGEALQRVRRMVDERGHMVSFPVEVRFTAPDDVPLSTASGRPSAYIAVHMYKGTPFEPYFRDVAAIMADYDGRPHWGKMHFLGADELSRLYPQWEAFQQARQRIDPMRTFANAYTDRVLGD
ncbi:MAG: FAD-binding protein [Ilumatobacteraceae bacterium]|jgi:FAD-linked oxidoreductase|nr:FAD-binding protein [Ilumatobacteraceae bacterium]